MDQNPKVVKFPIFLKNPLTGLVVAVFSENEWESIQKIGKKKIISRHRVLSFADRIYLQDILSAGWEKISEKDWIKEKTDTYNENQQNDK